ncbi:cation-translocating P-type ATPase [Rummeliibacillus pycnus]|uniref:cation-translocating P-type ATPase n=1 Tax=Rummeliibacillus pycnus TaxID=101070 RepID=UPI000C9A0497|nr:cation-translocating P-type ATPase [Rummeliibacillus pycnus]
MSEFHQQSTVEVMDRLDVTNQGLNDYDVQMRQEEYGYNELEEGKRTSTLAVFLEQFKDLLVIILMIAAVISFLLGEVESTVVIMIVVILNAILGTVQHVKAEQSLDNLKALTSPVAKVLRNNQIVEIPSAEIVIGDLLFLEAGDYVSADGRLLESHNLQINESSLTGESLAVAKSTDPIREDNVPIADKTNMVFTGSFVTNGRGTVIVTAIGMDTEIGKIANLLDTAKEKKTPLQISLDNFGEKLALAITLICLFIFTIDLVRGRALVESFMFAVSLAVAAIPEALSSIVTIVLAFGTQKMAKENAIIRKLYAVESLGSVSVICSDKTGTLTQNKMAVQQVFVDQQIIPYNQLNRSNIIQEQCIVLALLCNNALTSDQKEIGDPTELALVKLGRAYQYDEFVVRESNPRIAEIPFDSERKLMSTLNRINQQNVMITKGALDVLLPRIVKMETSNGIINFTEEHRKKIEIVNRNFSKNGLRVLAITYKNIAKQSIDIQDEKDLIFVGLIAMMDPPREESRAAVASCIKAGIKPVMITGDHKITATAIAKQIGILKNPSEAIEGHEIEGLTDEELQDKVEDISVYARVSPEHKLRIVKAWQEKGNVVAMTGDGVNDGPALKQADIGVAMGITGTEVAKDASSMVLTDDNFSTIVKAIANGRSLYANIKNAIMFLLSGNAGAIFVVLYATIFGLPVPFAPVHLLFINLLTDSLPAIAIGLEPHSKKIMKDKPRNIHQPLLNKKFTTQVMLEGIVIAISTIIAFRMGLATGDTQTASTMAFTTLCLSRLIHGFNSRSKESIFAIGVFSNKYTWVAFIIGVICLHLVLFVPSLTGVFEVAKLSSLQFGYIYVLSFIPFLVNQWFKVLYVRMR